MNIIMSIFLFLIIVSWSFASIIPEELKGVYIGMSIGEFKKIRPNAKPDETFFGETPHEYNDKTLISSVFSSASFEFGKKNGRLFRISLGQSPFKKLNIETYEKKKDDFIKYCITNWGPDYTKTIWRRDTYKIPCLIWQKKGHTIIASFRDKDCDRTVNKGAPGVGFSVFIFDSKLKPEEVYLIGIQRNPDVREVEEQFKTKLPNLEKITKETQYVEMEEYIPKKDEKFPIVSLITKEYDFGKIKYGEKVIYDIIINNIGQSELEIYNVETDCFCTMVNIVKKKIGPKESGKITIEFNSKGKKGKQEHKISIYTNDIENYISAFTLKGEVIE